MATQLRLLRPDQYHSLFLEKNIRPDGRKLTTFGETSISVGCISTANGSALVNLKETTVICAIKGELCNPTKEYPNKGFIVPNVDFPTVCSSAAMPGPPPFFVQLYSQLIAELLESTTLVDLVNLCIEEGKLCWCLHVDITCLNHCGNALDAIVLALAAAFATTTIPDVVIEDSEIKVKSTNSVLKTGLLTFSSTFGIFDKGVIADPSREEESLAKGVLSVFMQENGTLCKVFMQSGCVNESFLKQCIQFSKKRCKKLTMLIKKLKYSVDN